MKTFSNSYTTDIVIMIPAGDNKILTGSKNGDIRLWTITQYSDNSYSFSCDQLFSGHSGTIICLALLPKGRFVSTAADNSMRVWDIASGTCEKTLQDNRPFGILNYESLAVLPGNLVVGAGNCSQAWGAFDVWDIETRESIFRGQGLVHRPHGMSLAVANGYLVSHSLCRGMNTWKINRTECIEMNYSDNERIYSMTASASGEIITGGFSITVFKICDDGIIQKIKSLQNTNATDTTLSLSDYKVLTVDRQGACSGTLKLWNTLTETSEVLGNSCTPFGKVSDRHIVLPKNSLVLSISEGQICIQQFSNFANTPSQVAEIRKNSRILAQAFRTKTSFFGQLPKELNIKIAALTSNTYEENTAEKISGDHFRAPSTCYCQI